MKDRMEVCPLSRGVMSNAALIAPQPLSALLQDGFRFLHHPLPAALLASLAARFPFGKATGLPSSVTVPSAWLRFRLFAGGASSAIGEMGTPIPDPLPFWFKPMVSFGDAQHLWLVPDHDVYTCTCAQVQVSAVQIS
jgi:hypothetical protein